MHIHAYSGILSHNQAYSGIIQAYSESCVTLAHKKTWHIQNQRHNQRRGVYRALAYSEPEAYSEHWYIQSPGIFRTLVCSEPQDI